MDFLNYLGSMGGQQQVAPPDASQAASNPSYGAAQAGPTSANDFFRNLGTQILQSKMQGGGGGAGAAGGGAGGMNASGGYMGGHLSF